MRTLIMLALLLVAVAANARGVKAPLSDEMQKLQVDLSRLLEETPVIIGVHDQEELPTIIAHDQQAQRIVKGCSLIQDNTGKLGWFKPSTRKVNACKKVIDLGLMGPGTCTDGETTEGESGQQLCELAASAVGELLKLEWVAKTTTAQKGAETGTFQQHADGIGAQEFIDWDTMKIRAAVLEGIMPQLSDLQAFDYLIGNVDRHVENYLIEQGTTYKVKAIDNDLSFPTKPVEQLGQVFQSKFRGLPDTYSSTMADKINELDPELLHAVLLSLSMKEDSIKQALDRLDKLKKDIVAKRGSTDAGSTTNPYLLGPVFEE